MTAVTLAAAVVSQAFPAGTTDADFEYTVSGILADGTAFSSTQASGSFDLADGVYTGTVSKTVAGTAYASMASAPLTISSGPTTVTLSVPDGAQAAALTLA